MALVNTLLRRVTLFQYQLSQCRIGDSSFCSRAEIPRPDSFAGLLR